jgi:hypothetical protein
MVQPVSAAPATAKPAAALAAPMASPSGGMATPAPKKMAFLSALRPIKLSEAKPSNHVILIGNKGVKTISAVAVDLLGGTSPNGRTTIRATPGLPRPDGSRVVVITFDNQSSQSLLNHYGSLVDTHGVEVYHIMDTVKDANGVLIYPGWDGGSAESGTIVSTAFKELLVSLRESNNVGLLVIDHYGKFLEDVCKYHAYKKANMPLDGKLEPSQWTPRANLINDIDHLVRTVPMEGGWVICTGSRDQREGSEKTTFDKKDSNGKMLVQKEVVPSKWTEKVLHNWANIIQVYKLQLPSGNYAWRAEVEEGRHPIFPLGAVVDISGRHIGAFQDKAALKFPDDEVHDVKVQASTKPGTR